MRIEEILSWQATDTHSSVSQSDSSVDF